jgi:ribonuclease D
VAGRARQRRDAAHEGAADAEYVYVHEGKDCPEPPAAVNGSKMPTLMNRSNPSDLIVDQPGLLPVAERLAAAAAVGVDTEFLRERTYFAQLCLLQLSVADGAFCIDTLALRDLQPLRATLSNPAIAKVLHAARQDLEVLWPATGPVVGLFDTQVAAALIGLPAQIGYGDLVNRLLSVSLHKGETRTDWSRRPLTAAQLAYAVDDVRYLLPLREQLGQRLEQLGRRAWFDQEMAELDAIGSFEVDPAQAFRRFKGFSELDPDRQRIAAALSAWREQRAISSDRPRNWILADAALRDIVMRAPRKPAELAAIPELPEGVLNHSGPQILALIEAADLPERLAPLPQRQRPDPDTTAAIRKLSQLAQQIGRELGMAPELLATRREMERLVAGARDGAVLKGWRREVVGERLLGAL